MLKTLVMMNLWTALMMLNSFRMTPMLNSLILKMLRKLLFLLTYPRNLKYSMKDAPNNIFIIINFFKIIISNLFLSFSFNWWLVFLNPPLNPSGSQPQTCLEQCSSCSESDPWCRYTIWVNPFWTPNWATTIIRNNWDKSCILNDYLLWYYF